MNRSRLVYSTATGPVARPKERRPPTPEGAAKPARRTDGSIRISRERGGRGGKVVTVIDGLPAGETLIVLAAELKRMLGTGGTVKGESLEIQGDHRDRLAAWLAERGPTVKLVGG